MDIKRIWGAVMAKRKIFNCTRRPALEGLNEAKLKRIISRIGQQEGKEGLIAFTYALAKQYEENDVWANTEGLLEQLDKKVCEQKTIYEKYQAKKKLFMNGDAFRSAFLAVDQWWTETYTPDMEMKFSDFRRFVAINDDSGQKTNYDGTLEYWTYCSESTLYRAFRAYAEIRNAEEAEINGGLESCSVEELEEFAFMISVAFLNYELPSLLANYLGCVVDKKMPHRKRGKINAPLFRKIPSIRECEERLKNYEI